MPGAAKACNEGLDALQALHRELRDLCISLNKEGSTVFCFHAENFF